MKMTPRSVPVLVIAAVCLLLASTGGAVAGSLITGKQIKDNTITSRDIKNRTLTGKDLSKKTVASLKGSQGAPGRNAWDAIPAGKTVTGYFYDTGMSGATANFQVENISFPGKAPSAPSSYGFGADSIAESPEDATCTGSFDSPTAPAGQVCVYLDGLDGFTDAGVYSWDNPSAGRSTFYLSFTEEAADTSSYYYGVWAYRAP
ncbi:hypothetical protein [Nocardioides sp. 503]|uniref:hypothetical protein n=1 Tax=Nocardioides sp. 503 TaxID=2508326 RepID=UPI001070525E|nr:hypothetical protein [Nocardioides sp. 503]